MGSLTTCCFVFFIAVFSLSIFTSLLVIPVALWHPDQFYPRINALIAHMEHSEDIHWGYGVLQKIKELLPKDWGKKYSDCDLNIQSPINFEMHHVINNSLLVPLQFVNYDAKPSQDIWTVTNNGHTVQFTANFLHSPQLAGGGLVAGKYDFRQLHFHWGANDTRGSEHAIEGRQYPIEVHLVHIKSTKDPSPYRIAVLGVFFEISDQSPQDGENSVVSQMTLLGQAAKAVQKPGTSKEISLPRLTLDQFVPTDPSFYRYYGSLTTPPCSQYLQWTVMAHPLPITKTELDMFRQLLAGHASDHEDSHDSAHLLDNFRPYQNVTGRAVSYFGGWK